MERSDSISSLDPNVAIYSSNTPGYKQMYNYFLLKQNGLCRFCKKVITQDSRIVKKEGHPSKYYHEMCARTINIL